MSKYVKTKERDVKSLMLILVLLTIVPVLVTACEPTAPFQIRNGTNQTVNIFVAVTYLDHIDASDSRVPEGSIEPGQVLKLDGVTASFLTYLIEARGSAGNIVYSKEFSVSELRKANWKIVIPP